MDLYANRIISNPPDPTSPVNSNDACMSIVNSMLCHRQGGENLDFSRKAIESLVKKLKEKPDELDNLITSVTTNGTQIPGCVTIPRTLDGRLQIAGRKCFPHVIYARIWRWPNLHKAELRQNKHCEYGYEMKLDYVCINPYHYDRVVPSAVDISELSLTSSVEDLDDSASPSLMDADLIPDKVKYLPNCSSTSEDVQQQQAPRARMNLQYGGSNHLSLASGYDQQQHQRPSGMSDNTSNCSSPPAVCTESMFKPRLPQKPHPETEQHQHHDGYLQHNGDTFKIANLAGGGGGGDQNGATGNSSGTQQQQGPQRMSSGGHGSANANNSQQQHGFGGGNNSANNWGHTLAPQPLTALTHQKPPEFWCTIAYFELNQQVGEIFKVPSHYSIVTVDGYTDPSSPNRFCLGQLSNVHRSESSEKSRLYIGKGVELNNVGEGDVWIRCLSSHSVFVQSYYLDREAGRQPGDAVHKIYPGAYIKVFDIRQCHQQMRRASQEAQLAWARQAAVVAGSSNSSSVLQQTGPASSFSTTAASTSTSASSQQAAASSAASASVSNQSAAGIGVDDLSPFCVLRLSFVKGWGPDYPRHSIKETPCWIEIKLNRPMQLLDEVLQSMSVNEYKPTRHFFTNYYGSAAGSTPATAGTSAQPGGVPGPQQT